MFKVFRRLFWKFRLSLPENKVRADYYDMLQKLKSLEEQVEERAKQLELAKTSFLKNLYHEIRTPLNAIIGFTNLVAGDNKISSEDKEEYLNLLNNSSSDFLKIMDDIIQASLLEAGMVKFNYENCNLNKFMDESHSFCSLRKHLLEKNKIALLNNVSSKDSRIEIVCDRFYISQIMNQLLENALKFTEKGTIEYGYKLKNQNVEFYVKDSGAGNLKGKERFLFSRFTKINIADNSKSGLGLGLSNCKNLLGLMNGKIWYNSLPGRGTCFYFSIPFIPAQKDVSDGEESTETLDNTVREQKTLAV